MLNLSNQFSSPKRHLVYQTVSDCVGNGTGLVTLLKELTIDEAINAKSEGRSINRTVSMLCENSFYEGLDPSQ